MKKLSKTVNCPSCGAEIEIKRDEAYLYAEHDCVIGFTRRVWQEPIASTTATTDEESN